MRVLSLALGLLALEASAAPKVSLLKFTGPRAPQVREALVSRVCAKASCVEPEAVTTRFAPDWQKAAAQDVGVLVTGVAARKGAAVELTVQVLQGGQEKSSTKLDLPKEGLSDAALAKLTDAVLEPLGLLPKTAPVATPKPEPTPEPVVVAPGPPPEVKTTPPAAEPAREDGAYGFAAELGVNAANRSFDYLGARVPELRAYFLPVVALATARVEAFPFRTGALGGLGFELGGNLAPWIASAPPGSRDSLPTFAGRTDLAVQYRLLLGRVRVTPLVGARVQTFTVMGATETGARIDGLPNLVYVAARAGVSADMRFGERVTVFVRGAALPVLSASELLTPAYFPRGWAMGVEATGGVGVKLFSGVEVRVSADWTRYMFSFDTNVATANFYAMGAFDQYLGGTAVVRFEL